MKVKLWLCKIIDIMGISAFSVMILVASIQIIRRYILNEGFDWADELCTYLMIWIAFLGAVKAVANDEHTRITAIVDLLPSKVKVYLLLFSDILCAAFCIILPIISFDFIKTQMGNISVGLHLPMGLVYCSLPFSSIIMFFLFCAKIYTTLRQSREIGGSAE